MVSLPAKLGVLRSFSPGDLLQEGTICALCDTRGYSGDTGGRHWIYSCWGREGLPKSLSEYGFDSNAVGRHCRVLNRLVQMDGGPGC